jgi:hypothetical protein
MGIYGRMNEERIDHIIAKYEWMECQAERAKEKECLNSDYVFKTERQKLEEKHGNKFDF